MHLSQAAKYLMRAGKKMDSAYYMDVAKALWWLVRALKRGDRMDLVEEATNQ